MCWWRQAGGTSVLLLYPSCRPQRSLSNKKIHKPCSSYAGVVEGLLPRNRTTTETTTGTRQEVGHQHDEGAEQVPSHPHSFLASLCTPRVPHALLCRSEEAVKLTRDYQKLQKQLASLGEQHDNDYNFLQQIIQSWLEVAPDGKRLPQFRTQVALLAQQWAQTCGHDGGHHDCLRYVPSPFCITCVSHLTCCCTFDLLLHAESTSCCC